ncbi:gliding motility lipoprotein GldH [Sphingobacterium psychroaquaticum]|uniref:Gliding motility-associated lipoprotein GldH n=1 Tax=Sphingobacterium psychroaquaticum TaxID=561061 RepID=A0A1X7KB94_9SPHI|nr:gliding motility lipoprotein GldH [Sphingobacterium psychroaquaticum]QBQ39637.1 gliding motility lipoprotein GldH [Sphingobacterium psychroaquaticum]SMG38109.1 gliding motility-associated lipoprotein GldH [Sphingobacterium psychroaquaticum]
MRKIVFTAFSFLLLFATACEQQNFYEVNKPILNRSWAYNSMPTFDVKIDDNKAHYDVYIHVRHTGDYNYSNLFFLLHEKGPKVQDTAYRYEVKFAELDGRWMGKNAGSLYSNEVLVKKDFTFPDTGLYHFSVEQNMRENPLKHIADIGIKLIKKP